jgi:SRSO17 transposase
MDLRYNDIYLKGKEEEKERWTIKIISNGLKQNLSLDMIASIADVSVEEVKQYIKDNHLDKK